jgi:hypothetical protein
MHQMDLVGPRYIKNDGRFYALNIIDVFSHRVYIDPQRTKEDHRVATSLMRCWKTMGIPMFLQMDNELSFRGSNRYPRSLGIVLRVCLHYGVIPVFIPTGEPWRNGIVERFNDTFNRKFFRRQFFPSYATLKQQAKYFQRFHNRHHRYSCLNGKTPEETVVYHNFKPLILGPNTKIPLLTKIPDGHVMFIRFIRTDRVLDIFGEKFKVSEELIYSYVKAVIATSNHTLEVYHGDELVQSFPYELPAHIYHGQS